MRKKYNQIVIEPRCNNEADVYLELPHFNGAKKLGTLYRDISTFRSIPRSSENLFHRFREGRPGLGINVEVLTRLNFEFIEIPFNNETLRTTRAHFLEKSIPSPFKSERVDPQRILMLDEFNVPAEKEQLKEATLFEEVE